MVLHTLVVACETLRATHADLPARIGFVLGRVSHRRDVNELNLAVRERRADRPAGVGIVRPCPDEASAVLRHSVTVQSDVSINTILQSEEKCVHPAIILANSVNEVESQTRTFDHLGEQTNLQEVHNAGTDRCRAGGNQLHPATKDSMEL